MYNNYQMYQLSLQRQLLYAQQINAAHYRHTLMTMQKCHTQNQNQHPKQQQQFMSKRLKRIRLKGSRSFDIHGQKIEENIQN